MTDPLFQPILINTMQVKNRIFMPAMHMNMAGNYAVTDRLVDFYAERAKGGAGMITVGYATVDELSGNPGNIGAHKDAYIPGLARLATAIRENGARASVQLNHAGRYNHSMLMGGKQPVAPSAIPSRLTRETPRELTIGEIREIIGRFAQAAGRVKEAGFDAVEILFGTGYLISEFLSPLTNKRSDEYGGPFENRIRFGLEVITAVRLAVGSTFPLLVRMNGNEFMKGGSSRQELQEYAVRLAGEGVDAICVNVGWHEAQVPQIASEVPRAVFAYLARAIKERVPVPVIASHRINDPEVARELLTDGVCDMVALGRALIADPFFPEKARCGRERDIVHCVACGQGCFDNLFKMKPVECLCNPRAGYESTRTIGRTDKPLQVMVVGGGPAGMEAALIAARRGHDVTLYEKAATLGGAYRLASTSPTKAETERLFVFFERALPKYGVTLALNTEVTPELVEQVKPDVAILATGSKPALPAKIPGVEGRNVVSARDIMSGTADVGDKVVIWTCSYMCSYTCGVKKAPIEGDPTGTNYKYSYACSAGYAAVDTAEYLASQGKLVSIVTEREGVVPGMGYTSRNYLIKRFYPANIRVCTGAKVKEINENGVVIDKAGIEFLLDADNVVISVGERSDVDLAKALDGKVRELYQVGDGAKIGNAMKAIESAFKVALEI